MTEILTDTVTMDMWQDPTWKIEPYHLTSLDIPVMPPKPLTKLESLDLDRMVLRGKIELERHDDVQDTKKAFRKRQTRKITQRLESATANRFIELAGLEVGWDGFGGSPISLDAIKTGTQLLLDIEIIGGGRLTMPFIAPLPDGGIELEWEFESGKELMLIVPPSGKEVRFLYSQQKNTHEYAEEAGKVINESILKTLVDRLLC